MSDSYDGGTGRDLVDVIFGLAADSDTLPEGAKLLVLAALEGDDELATALNGTYVKVALAAEVPVAEPAGVFLRSIEVRGFRGVGPVAKLAVRPMPGLTVVVGRNGSGKSSFSDALELTLTGNTYRWSKKRAGPWAEHWRNVHHGAPCQIRVELAEESAGVTTVGVDWADDAALADRRTWVQRTGKKRESGVSVLGWDRAIELYQPILSYDELGGVLEQGPSTLFDKIDAILGVEQATDAEKRLGAALKELQESDRDAKAQARELKKTLATLTDKRALLAYDLLRKRPPDIDAIEAIATGTTREPVEELAELKALTQLELPPRDDVIVATQALREAANACAEAAVTSIDIATRRASLLREVLTFHEHHGDGQCPACGQGVLNAAWRARVVDELGADIDEIDRHRVVHQRLTRARDAVRSLLAPVPLPVLPGRIELASFADALSTRRQWLGLPERDEEIANHLESGYDDLDVAFGLVRQEAESVLTRFEDEWVPHASALATWVGAARKASEAESTVQIADAAHKFIKAAVEQVRDQRLARLTGTARDIWAALKQESNVNLGKIELKGTNNRRRLELKAEVDGVDAQALGVMSQGELHALALALFLPRAIMQGSPFRFVVLDDPIQAMDPAKVDGFVRVLAKLAVDRQVLVFSHDDRLPQAVRQLGVDAEILEVSRHGNSSVDVAVCVDPAARYLEDAVAICADDVPPNVRDRIIPGLCRMAVETAAHDVYQIRRFNAGDSRADVEATWREARTTRHRLALAVRDDTRADLTAWLDQKPWRRPGCRVVTSGPHEGIHGDARNAIAQVGRIVNDLRALT